MIKTYWMLVGWFTLAVMAHILISVIGFRSGSQIWGDVPESYSEPMLFLMIAAAPLAYVLHEET